MCPACVVTVSEGDVAVAAESNLQGSTLYNRYKLDGELARGALCVVYRGQDIVLRRSVVVKALPADLAPVYRASLHTTAAFTHPAVVATYDALDQDGWLYLVQEFVPARPLSAYVKSGIPSERTVDLGGQIARALAYAHAHEMIHGDLTPAAVLIDRQAIVRVNNFGLPPDDAYFKGAVASLGPEAATLPPQSAEGDVLACGLLMWQVLSEPVRTAPASGERAGGRRDFRQDVPEAVRELVRRCVLREHPRRIVEAETLALEVEALVDELAARRHAVTEQTPPALRVARNAVAREAAWSVDETQSSSRPWAPYADEEQTPRYDAPAAYAEPRQPRWPLPAAPAGPPRRQTLAPRPLTASATMRDERPALRKGEQRANGVSIGTYLLIFLGLFILFFLIGFFLPYMLGRGG